MPGFIKPCLARAVPQPPSDAGWVHEIKMDGYRVQAHLEDGRVMLLTRTGLDWTDRFLGLVPAFEKLSARSAVIDGEIIVEDKRGVSDFSLLQAALKSPRSTRLAFVAFDLLYLDGENLLGAALSERKHRLEQLLAPASGPLRYSQHFAGDGGQILAEVAKLGLEGVVSKRLDSPYKPGREDWCKTKITMTDEFVLCGYIDATSPKDAVGSLALGFHENGQLIYAGRVGTGFTRHRANELWRELQAFRIGTCQVSGVADDREREITWVTPDRVVQVEYAGWTSDNLLRHARYKGAREDKPASEIVRPHR